MEVQIVYQMLCALLFICVCSLGYTMPTADSMDSLDGVQNDDDYQYSDDESMPSSHTKSTEASLTFGMVPFFARNNVTVVTIAGKNAVLECPVKNLSDHNVVVWYKGSNALTNGPLVLNKEYTLDTNFSLKVINVTEADQDEYFCEIIPQKIRFHTTLIVNELPIETIVPKSSTSSQESVYFKVSTTLTTYSVIGIFLFLRI
ncbi:uncharacterized protein LOC129907425 [Episyrphus balteatus]|uniref:uncharacterized protein LOC129907425 n=1 Tax=Episyrphus balteatus TaxID=286459 RepID=UPI00248633E3|nr:uncharacterized protein LOC129907425 [Episyrphus balteatus]